jgi:hypothetical protein
LAANKSDMWEYEEVNMDAGKQLASSVNGLFFETSAKVGSGIDVIFFNIGNIFKRWFEISRSKLRY